MSLILSLSPLPGEINLKKQTGVGGGVKLNSFLPGEELDCRIEQKWPLGSDWGIRSLGCRRCPVPHPTPSPAVLPGAPNLGLVRGGHHFL